MINDNFNREKYPEYDINSSLKTLIFNRKQWEIINWFDDKELDDAIDRNGLIATKSGIICLLSIEFGTK